MTVTINRKRLTRDQIMTLEAALCDFRITLDDGLGDSEEEKALTAEYLTHIAAIMALMGVDREETKP